MSNIKMRTIRRGASLSIETRPVTMSNKQPWGALHRLQGSPMEN
jgi:hypothetical protein